MFSRRRALLALGLATASSSGTRAEPSAANQWFPLRGDDGHPVPNIRLPVELVAEIEELPGALWGGGGPSPAMTMAVFYDFNCPWCRASVGELPGLMAAHPDMRVGLVNNPILSPQSAQAAKVQIAILQLKGPGPAHAFYTALFAVPGRVDGPRALDLAASLGHARAEVLAAANEHRTGETLGRQMRLAASLGLVATPSYVVGGAGLLGYPGAKTMDRVGVEHAFLRFGQLLIEVPLDGTRLLD